MKNFFLVTVICLVYQNIVWGQYYYDRSKNPDRNTGLKQQQETQDKPSRDFDHFFFLSWDGNQPKSNTSFIANSSSLGTRLGFRKRINDQDNIWVGVDGGWSVYNQYVPYQTYAVSNTQTISTDLYNYSYNYSLTANIDYFILPMQRIFAPYVGVGVGGAYDKFATYYNISGSSSGSWGLLLRPEVGFLLGFKVNSSWRLKAAYHYDYGTNQNSDFGYKNFINTGFQIGIVKMAW